MNDVITEALELVGSLPELENGMHLTEAVPLIECAVQRECANYIEVGQRRGVSTRLFAYLARHFGGKVVSIEAHPMLSTERKLAKIGLSNYVETISAASPWVLYDMSWEFDFLYIDGDHSFISVIVDYHAFNYFVKQNGLIAFHDVDAPYVMRAVEEAIKRDGIKPLQRAERTGVYEKTTPRGETHFYQKKRF